MKFKILAGAFAVALTFSGCANNGLALNTMGENQVDRYFQKGTIQTQRKVIIDDRMTASLAGVAIGAGGGQIVGRNTKSTAIGAVAGGLIGAIIGKEVVAYETTILSENKTYKGYLKQALTRGTTVEFTVKDGLLKNVEVLQTTKKPIKKMTNEGFSAFKTENKPVVVKKEIKKEVEAEAPKVEKPVVVKKKEEPLKIKNPNPFKKDLN